MKTILFSLALLSLQFSFGQHAFGIKLAPGIQTTTYNSGIEYRSTFSLRSGLHYGYRFDEDKPWSIQSGLYYNQRGYGINDLTLLHNGGFLEPVNVITKLNLGGINLLFKAEHKFLYASLGPCFEYNFNRIFIIDYKNESITDFTSDSSPESLSEAIFFGYEVNLGTQFSLSNKLQFFSELSMNQVFSEKGESSNKRFNYLNLNLGIGLNYQF